MPGLHVHRSNRLETLADTLAGVTRTPLAAPLQPELIIVQSLGMRRWLSLELAQRLGVTMNCQFPFPAAFAQTVFEAAFPGETTEPRFSREVLPWRILELLPQLWSAPDWDDLRRYAAGELGALKEYQLAHQIAAAFDRYLAYRPELLLQWQENRPGDWQAQLWRQLTQGREERHPPALLRRLTRRLDSGKIELPGMPERLAIFGISSLPPFYLHLLQAVARCVEVHLFLLEPTPFYWGDIRSPREQSRLLRQQAPTARAADLHLESGHPLLASLGQSGRDFTRLVQDLEPDDESENFEPPARETLLGQLQADLFDLYERPPGEREMLAGDDGSLRVHCCHGPLREVEVLHDQLLDLFQKTPGLTPRDILVAMPDVESYAPFIDTVFGAPEDEQHTIPFTIADRSARAESGLADTFLRLLDLHGSRFGVTSVLALLDCPAVRRRFELAEGDLDAIRTAVARTGIRWGIDAAHRASLGLPAFAENSWRAGLDRLLLGYALPGDGRTLFDGILPRREMEGSLATTLGRFVAFATTLFDLIPRLATPRPPREWQQACRQLLRAFFVEGDDFADELRRLRETFTAFGTHTDAAAFSRALPFEVLRAHLGSQLADSDSGVGFLAGRVTFCALKPMRSIPFKVICLLGLNDNGFPRRDTAPAFDLLSSAPAQRGDRSARDDDRHLFLEAILSAREVLHLSYSGLSPRDQTIAPPSVVVSELLDHLEENFAFPEQPLRAALVVPHRLQAFSPAYFGSDPRLFSYSPENARTCADRSAVAAGFSVTPLDPPEAEWFAVDLDQLATFFAHPTKFFLRELLRLTLPADEPPLDETEPLELHALDRYQLGTDLTALALAGHSASGQHEVARAAGSLPPGYAGGAAFAAACHAAESLAARVRALDPGEPLAPRRLDLTLGPWRLTGTLHGAASRALLRYRSANVKATDLLRAWIAHLALQLVPDSPRETLLVGRDATWRFRPVPEAATVLADLLAGYGDGLRRPLPLFPTTSLEFARRTLLPRKSEKADPLAEARKKWFGSENQAGSAEADDGWLALCFPPESDPLDAAWQDVSLRVFGPLLAAREEVSG